MTEKKINLGELRPGEFGDSATTVAAGQSLAPTERNLFDGPNQVKQKPKEKPEIPIVIERLRSQE